MVTNLDDGAVFGPGDQPGTLRQAIFDAGNIDGPDTIVFSTNPAHGLNGQTITLTEGQLFIGESVTIDASMLTGGLTIKGNNPDNTPETFDGDRIFDIFGFGAFVPTVEINGLTLTGGDERLKGGAIQSVGANLTLRNTIITGNSSSGGGGIYFQGSGKNLTIISSTISHNSLGYGGTLGGGALITGTNSSIVISDSTISENTASAFQGNGGGMYLSLSGSGSSIEISDTTISGNKALGSGTNAGGMFLKATSANAILDRLQVFNNETDDDAGGLFLMNSGGEVRLRNSAITGNTARDNDSDIHGGGGLVITTYDGAETIVENSTIAFNEAYDSSGGGLFIEGDSQTTTTIVNTTISNNRAGRDGGGIKFNYQVSGGSVNILHSTITNNRANWDDDSTGFGGGIHRGTINTAVTLDHTIVAGNFRGTGATRSDIVGSVAANWSLIGDNTGATIIGANNLEGTSGSPIDPGLMPLANNGGFTLPDGSMIQTHALLSTSDARNAGNPSISSPPTYDQRGTPFTREAEDRIDIGAFEFQTNDFPTITDVKVARVGTGPWSVSFAERVSHTTGSQQFRPIAEANANVIEITFSEPVIIDGSELTLHRTRRLSGGSVVNEVLDDVGANDWSFSYNPNTFTGTWTFATPLLDGKYSIHLSDDVRDLAGNRLDAEWHYDDNGTPDTFGDDPQRSFQYNTASGIGNGEAGTEWGMFRFHFALLAGDTDGDGFVAANNMLPLRIHDGADFDDNEIVDGQDLLWWQRNYGLGAATHAQGDANGDKLVNGLDLQIWQDQYGQTGSGLQADFDGDNDVDGHDFLIWQQNYGLGYGDANNNGLINGQDFLIWQLRFSTYSVWSANYAPAFSALTVGAAPQVMNVVVSGSMSAHDPYSFDAVVGSGAQLATVPVGLADTISIVFSENVNVSAGSLFVVGLTTANLPELAEFSYDPLTSTATWRFEGWVLGDNYLLHLSDSVTDTEGNFLDGEWTNPASITTTNSLVSEFPSGDGDSGGAFNFVVTLLAGDMNLDATVDETDYDLLVASLMQGGGSLFIHGDFNGSGGVNNADVIHFVNNWLTNLQDLRILADFDGDGDVDGADLNVLYENYGLTNADWEDGDLNGDGTVDDLDIDLAFAQHGLSLNWVA